jgi:hypothetical protein
MKTHRKLTSILTLGVMVGCGGDSSRGSFSDSANDSAVNGSITADPSSEPTIGNITMPTTELIPTTEPTPTTELTEPLDPSNPDSGVSTRDDGTTTGDGTTVSLSSTTTINDTMTSSSMTTSNDTAHVSTDTTAETDTDGQGVDVLANPLDPDIGMNEYAGGLIDDNWKTDEYVQAHAGTAAFGSANGNGMGTFVGLGLKKNLGGIVEKKTYKVSFYVTMYLEGLSGIELADFSTLRIGGPAGVVKWTSTPTPGVEDEWVLWTGTYEPAESDLGGPFYFEAIFDLDAQHAVGFDGMVSAVPLP